jgi:hypothetical protein
MLECPRTQNILRGILVMSLLLTVSGRAQANFAIVYTDNTTGAVTTISGHHIFAQVQDTFIAQPDPFTLQVFGHLLIVDSLAGSGPNVTSLTFHSAELGINQTITGADTNSTSDALRLYLKSEAFLGPFYTLLNTSGGGATYSGTPYGTVDSVGHTALTNVLTPALQTAEEKDNATQLNSINVGVGLDSFDNQGFSGTDYKVSPAYTWKLGSKKDNELNLTVPLEQISIEGVRSYRVGTILQIVHPFYLPGGFVLKVGPDLSYSYLVSLDIPGMMTGTVGGGLTSALSKDWGPYFGDIGLFYGRFQALGGIPTGLKANSYSAGLQVGRRIGQRWAVAGYGIGVNDDVNGISAKDYMLAGASVAYKIYKSFNLQLSVNRTFGIPGFSDTTTNLGSAWNF